MRKVTPFLAFSSTLFVFVFVLLIYRTPQLTPLLASSSILWVTPRRNLTISTWLLRGACGDVIVKAGSMASCVYYYTAKSLNAMTVITIWPQLAHKCAETSSMDTGQLPAKERMRKMT